MILVPRQLRQSGMTGSVPYYGGRFTPAQAYAASHPSQPPPRGLASPFDPPAASGRAQRPARDEARRPPGPHAPADQLAALQHLVEGGVLTETEYEQLRARVTE